MKRSLPALALWATATAHAALVDLGPGSFMPSATAIGFGEVALGTPDPVYQFSALAGLGDVTVSFGGHFAGQAAGGGFPLTLVDRTPSGPLALDPLAPAVATVDDGAPGATSPVLGGTPQFNGPIAVLFSRPVAAVGLKGGSFDAIGTTTIEAYDASGASLGSIVNSATGFEFYGLADSNGGNVIAGISFFITGNEVSGFEIDDLTFGSARDVTIPSVPEPGSAALAALGLAGVAIGLRRRAALRR